MLARSLARFVARLNAPRRRNSESGASAVEFALVLPLLVMLLLGTVTGGIAYSHGIGLSNAVREGGRFAATGDAAVPSWADDVILQLRRSQFDDGETPATSSTSVCIQLWKYTTPGTNLGTGTAKCSAGNSTAPALSMPAQDAYPKIPKLPSTSAAGTCVVRVLAARKYKITL